MFSLTAGTFQARSCLLLAGFTGVLSFWYVFAPRRATYDIGFLVIAAAPVLLRVFPRNLTFLRHPIPLSELNILAI